MRGLALSLLALSVLLGGTRLLTGVIYLSDEPTVVFVLKRQPALWVARPEAQGHPLSSYVVLDREEPDLLYGRLYLSLMRAAPVLVPVLLCAAVLLGVFGRRARGRRAGHGRHSGSDRPSG